MGEQRLCVPYRQFPRGWARLGLGETIKIDHLYEAFWGHGAPPYAGGHPELLVRPNASGQTRPGLFVNQVLGRRAG